MAGHGMRQCIRDITGYLIIIIAIATLGSLQFGFHLVSRSPPSDPHDDNIDVPRCQRLWPHGSNCHRPPG